MSANLAHPSISAATGERADDLVQEGEILVVLGAPGGERAPWVQALQREAHPGLSKTSHYMSYAVGFLKNAAATPYVVVDWQKPGVNALERRWVLNKLGQTLSGQFSLKKLAVYLEKGSGPEQLVWVEDLWTRTMSARYERANLTSVRILSHESGRLTELDPFRAARLKGQVNFRSWVNENPDELTSLAIGERLRDFCGKNSCYFESLAEDKLKQLGMNLLLAVGQASERSPSRLHIATHNFKPKQAGGVRPLMLVGKGITFDTGGINLKPHESFVNCMKNDMGGAGLMANVFMALVESGYSGPLVCVIPCCENLIGERAMKPGSIIKSYAGKDVIIEHTDAEGRLILADALSYAQAEMNPALTITAATLTTASLRQFTNFFTAVHFANPRFQSSLVDTGRQFGEEFACWGEFLPFLQGNRTSAADFTNMGRMPSHASMGGGSNVAAHFLREFAPKPMVHFDIFATTWNWSGDYPGAHYGATGAPFNSLFQTLRRANPTELWGYGG